MPEGFAVLPGPGMSHNKRPAGVATYRADLLQDPEKAADSSFVDVSKRLIAGGFAGSLAKTVIAPLDRTKIIFQTSDKVFNASNAVREMLQIAKHEGFLGLWRGNSATVLRVFPYAGIQFSSFDLYKKMFASGETGHLTSVQRLAAGSAAGATAVALTYPLDLMRARLAVQRKVPGVQTTYWQVLSGGKNTVYIKDLYRGLAPTLLGILPYAGIAFFTRDTLNSLAAKHLHTTALDTPLGAKLASGAISGLIAQSSTYPLDLVRRRMQTEGFTEAHLRGGGVGFDAANTHQRYTTIRGTLKLIYAEGGTKGLFKGLSMNWVKGPIAFMISFTAFDYLKIWFNIKASPAEDFRKQGHKNAQAKPAYVPEAPP